MISIIELVRNLVSITFHPSRSFKARLAKPNFFYRYIKIHDECEHGNYEITSFRKWLDVVFQRIIHDAVTCIIWEKDGAGFGPPDVMAREGGLCVREYNIYFRSNAEFWGRNLLLSFTVPNVQTD